MTFLDWKRRVVPVFVVTAGVVLLAACGTSGSPSEATSSLPPGTSAVGVAPATLGSISETTAYAAIVEAKDQVDVVPLATGRIERLTVDIGSEVREGQVIAQLSHGTYDAQLEQANAMLRDAQARLAFVQADLEPKQINAQAQLDAARAALDQLLSPSAPDLRMAESAVAAAQSRRDSAKTKLEQLQNPSASDFQAAESAVATAQSSLDSAKTRLEQLLSPSASDLQTAQSAVATTQSALDSANTRLNQLLNPSASDLQAAKTAVATAQIDLDSANIRLEQLLSPNAFDLAAAREAVSDAQSKLTAAKTVVNQAITQELTTDTISAELRPVWEALLEVRIREAANTATLFDPTLSSALTPAEIASVELSVANDNLAISTFLAELVTPFSFIPEGINPSMLAESAAETVLDKAEAQLAELQNPSLNNVAVARNSVAIAQADLDSVSADLKDLEDLNQNTIDLAQADIDAAQAVFDSSTARLGELIDPSQNAIALAQNNVDSAQAALDSTKAELGELLDPSSNAIALAQLDVDAAQASLEAVEANLELLKNPNPADLAAANAEVTAAEHSLAVTQAPFTQFDTETAQADVDYAQAQVDLVRQQLAELQVLAPFDGFVTRKWLSPGAKASPQTPVVAIASSELVVSIRVEETGINSLQKGQQVTFTSAALMDRDVELQIDRIAPGGDEKSFTFLVLLHPAGDIADLKLGMSGQVKISTRHENAVLVPREAVLRQAGQPALFVVEDGKAHLRPVGVGLVDDKNVQVVGGIQPGEQVIVSGHNLLREGDPVSIKESDNILDDGRG